MRFSVDVWGTEIPFSTELYETQKEARAQFNRIKKWAKGKGFAIDDESIVCIEDPDSSAHITDLDEL